MVHLNPPARSGRRLARPAARTGVARSSTGVARSGGGRNAQVCRSRPPYQQWQRQDLDRSIGGPLLTKWHGHYVVGGRKTGRGKATTALWWLIDDHLYELANLPSGGDNSYPGFIELSPKKAVVSWYSSHEKDAQGKTITAIYLADLEIVDENP